ncbi:hypothetical protein HJG60_008486 [Phyllostomus discolor]|uniref:Uncharacterized protein n=1 Tax=Phyllostomus discolor TaxID=89673 RepID=A0A833Z527_9CHIR|nr:hypothetical protein HJG60_008486 [Phyllostomus discolor]
MRNDGHWRADTDPFPISQVNTGRRRRLPLLTLLHPREVSSSLASPHGSSRSSSENCPSRRQRRQQLLQSFPGRQLYSASQASPRPGCSRRTRRHLGRATSASPRDVRSHWRTREPPASRDCLHSAGASESGDRRPAAHPEQVAGLLESGARAEEGRRGVERGPNARLTKEPARTPAGTACPPPHAGVGWP